MRRPAGLSGCFKTWFIVRFQPLEKLINLHDGYRRGFKIDALGLLLIQHGGQRYLLEAQCPHRGHPLETADIEAGCLQCPLHQYRFDLSSGAVVAATEEACRPLRVFELVYEGNEVGLLMPD
jgi:nitrite reductase/ring-hydroxylating ferredoxin subunit